LLDMQLNDDIYYFIWQWQLYNQSC